MEEKEKNVKAREFTADNYNFFMRRQRTTEFDHKKKSTQRGEHYSLHIRGRERFAVNQVKRLKILDSCSMA